MTTSIKQLLLCMAYACTVIVTNAQPKIAKVEWYVDTDPGYNNATNVPVPSSADVQNKTVNLNPADYTPGVHLFCIRAKDAKGSWSLDNKWLFIKQPVLTNIPKITYAEWYVDSDPGYGNAEKIKVKSSEDLQNKTVKLDPADYTPGVHLFCIRAKDNKGAWSLDNKWLFIIQPQQPTVPKVNYAEWYVDTDPGYGNAKKINIGAGTDISNKTVNLNPADYTPGVHLFCVRAKDAKGAWSLDNKWLFIIQQPVANVPDIREVEFYIDKDPGYSKGTPIAISTIKDIKNFELPVNVSALKAGDHVLYIRSRDANNAWSLDNVDTFNIPSVINPATIVTTNVASTAICAGSDVKISYQANGKYEADNIFKVQLSNKSGSFSNPVVIGTRTGKGDAIINCTIPLNTQAGTNYKVRVISTNPNITGLVADDIITINAAPAKPVITSVPSNTSNLCPGTTVTLTSSTSGNYLWNTGATTQSITVDSAGAYAVTVSNAAGCSNVSDSSIISYSTCETPVSLKTKNIMTTTATLTWKPAGCAKKYQVQYRFKGSGTFISKTVSDTFYVVANLQASSQYEWQVLTICSTNPSVKSDFSKLVKFTTGSAAIAGIGEEENMNAATEGIFKAHIIPNPAASEAYVYIQTESKKDASVFLTDAVGKILWSAEHTFSKKIKLPANSISNGAYFVMIISGDEKKTLRFVKQQ